MNTLLRRLVKAFIRWYLRLRSRTTASEGMPEHPRSIAYFIGGGIGDAVMAYPAIKLLTKTYPDAAIDVYVPESKYRLLAPVFEGLRVRPLDARSLAALFTRRLYNERYDRSFTNTIAVFKVRIELAAGLSSRFSLGFHYPDETDLSHLYTRSLAVCDNEHDIDQNIKLIKQLPGVAVADEDRCYPQRQYPVHRGGTVTVLVHPGAEKGYENKLWPLENYKEIISLLIERKCLIKVLLGPADKEAIAAFKSMDGVHLLVEPDPSSLISEYKRTSLFIGNDSGPAHLAAFYGLKTITLIGPADPVRSAPRGRTCVALYKPTTCSPCHFTAMACSDNQCMKNITVRDVWDAAIKCIESRHPQEHGLWGNVFKGVR